MKSLDPNALEAASRAFRRMHNSVCYPSASESEANWAASEIVSAYLAAIDAHSKYPDPDLSSLRKGAEVGHVVIDRDLVERAQHQLSASPFPFDRCVAAEISAALSQSTSVGRGE